MPSKKILMIVGDFSEDYEGSLEKFKELTINSNGTIPNVRNDWTYSSCSFTR